MRVVSITLVYDLLLPDVEVARFRLRTMNDHPAYVQGLLSTQENTPEGLGTFTKSVEVAAYRARRPSNRTARDNVCYNEAER